MNIRIQLVDASLPLPQYHTPGSVAFDVYARVNTTIKPMTPTIVPLNIIVKVPKGYFLMLAARSSLARKKNLMVANGIGVIDEDYHGEKDEIGLSVLNFSKKTVTVEKGERIGQGIFVKIAKASRFVKFNSLKKKSRGGFGSTG